MRGCRVNGFAFWIRVPPPQETALMCMQNNTKTGTVLHVKIGSRSIRIRFSIGIVIAIAILKSMIDLKMKIADRF
jgi:hypothetical protein